MAATPLYLGLSQTLPPKWLTFRAPLTQNDSPIPQHFSPVANPLIILRRSAGCAVPKTLTCPLKNTHLVPKVPHLQHKTTHLLRHKTSHLQHNNPHLEHNTPHLSAPSSCFYLYFLLLLCYCFLKEALLGFFLRAFNQHHENPSIALGARHREVSIFVLTTSPVFGIVRHHFPALTVTL